MKNIISENSFEFKLKKNDTISDLNTFLNELPKFKRWLLFTMFYSNDIVKRTIINLENPSKEFKFFKNKDERFLIWLKSEILRGSLVKVKVEICKQKLF